MAAYTLNGDACQATAAMARAAVRTSEEEFTARGVICSQARQLLGGQRPDHRGISHKDVGLLIVKPGDDVLDRPPSVQAIGGDERAAYGRGDPSGLMPGRGGADHGHPHRVGGTCRDARPIRWPGRRKR